LRQQVTKCAAGEPPIIAHCLVDENFVRRDRAEQGFTALAQINAAPLTTSAMLWMNVSIFGYRENPNKCGLRLDGQRPNFAKLPELLHRDNHHSGATNSQSTVSFCARADP
jgi:hypothetical protein